MEAQRGRHLPSIRKLSRPPPNGPTITIFGRIAPQHIRRKNSKTVEWRMVMCSQRSQSKHKQASSKHSSATFVHSYGHPNVSARESETLGPDLYSSHLLRTEVVEDLSCLLN